MHKAYDLIKKLNFNIEKSKVDIIKWQFGFWVTIIGAIVAMWLSR